MKEFLKKIKAKHIIWLAVSVVLIVIAIVATCIAKYWDTALVGYFGTIGEGASGSATTDEGEEVDTQYYKSDYLKADGVTQDTSALVAAEEKLNLQMAEEGAVLIKNDSSALPLSTESGKNKVSVFSISSRAWLTGGKGSGNVSSAEISTLTVKSTLESAGLEVNGTLWDFYGSQSKYGRGTGTPAGDGNTVGDWSIGEVPQSEYTQTVKDSYSSYGDAAIVILSRNGGEGSDLPTDMSLHGGTSSESYLELDTNEKAMMQAIKDAKDSNTFKKVIVVINSANALQLDFLDTYGVDAVVVLPGTGTNGLTALGEVLTGKVNPSGRLVDTYVTDNFSAPATQNSGWNIFTSNGSNTDYSFMNYSEGIYVDYKYYETRYEDTVLGTSNVGTYDYAGTVVAPFGYGLSYTDFTYSDYSLTLADGTAITSGTEITADTELKASVTVTNSGSVAGKDVVEFYYQSPYTSYDQTNGVEKSSAELLGFYKTDTLAAGTGSETASVTFKVSDMKSYDSNAAKTYILDVGDYYITAATDAHNAVNNILEAKAEAAGATYSLVGEGDASVAASVTISGTESEPVKVSSSVSGATVTNQFDGRTAENGTYLSRSNWQAMDNNGLKYATGTTTFTSSDGVTASAGSREITSTQQAALAATGWSASGRPSSADDNTDAVYDQGVSIDLTYMIGADYDDENWDTVIQALKISELHTLFQKAGYSTQAVESINKPRTYDYDGPAGISNYLNGQSAYGFCCEALIAATWNTDLAEQFGKCIGEDGLKTGTQGWYAPAMNIHRTPFSGRNYEYFSADGVLSGKIAAATVRGAQSKGMYTYIKHFALNDQESFRTAFGSVSVWAQEQAIRETYLTSFEIAVEEGGAKAVMTSMNRIGAVVARGDYNLITNVLRGEWGFVGLVCTDYVTTDTSGADQILSAGGDCILNTGGCPLSDTHENYVRHALQNAAHDMLYVVANSAAMNGLAPGIKYSSGFAIYNFIIIAMWVVFAAVIVVWGVLIFKKKKDKAPAQDAAETPQK